MKTSSGAAGPCPTCSKSSLKSPPATSTVLIEGSSGTGKELVARAIHNLSERRGNRFVAVNCSALPDTLLESELFGYKAGAFTGARRDKPGRFELAEGGTLLLDEIGDVTTAMQVKLLRVLQEKTFEPLGAVTSQKMNVRILAATNRDLAGLVRDGTFREDLFYRIHVFRIELPDLRQRREDIPLLVDHFIEHFNRIQNKDVTGISEAALDVLMKHDFPGNVRELENIIEHAFVLCRAGPIELRHLPPSAAATRRTWRKRLAGKLSGMWKSPHIEATLARLGGNRTEAARELGIHPSTLFRKLKTLGISLPEGDGANATGLLHEVTPPRSASGPQRIHLLQNSVAKSVTIQP